MTAVVTILCVLGLIANVLKPLIPDPAANPIASQPGDFMRQAFRQSVSWTTAGQAAFAEARRLDRPILLVVGHSWSATGRHMDREVFVGPEVANFINANFIPVRIDGDVEPSWVNAYLPLSRPAFGIRPDFQIWVLSPAGALVQPIYRPMASQSWDRTRFLNELIEALHLAEQVRDSKTDSPHGLRQIEDIQEVKSPDGASSPDLLTSLRQTLASVHPEFGGFPFNGFQELKPNAWRLIALSGYDDLLKKSLRPVLLSPMVDVQDGGFFSRARRDRWREIEYDKPAVLNSEMMLMLLIASKTTKDPEFASFCDYLARTTLNSLSTEFKTQTGLIFTARQGDESDQLGRSERSSFSPRRLRSAADDGVLRTWMHENLGLRVETNRQMVPLIKTESVLNDPTFERALAAMKADYVVRKRFTGGIKMKTSATVAARQMQVARALGDDDRGQIAAQMFDWIDTFRTVDQVPHDLAGGVNDHEFLGDYLAYADAALQDYLGNGRVVSLFRGLSVLNRALLIFQGDTPGELRQTQASESELVPNAPAIPELLDNLGESTTATAIRLCSAYGRLLLSQSEEDDRGLRLLRRAYALTSHFAETAPPLGYSAAGYSCAAAEVIDDRFALAVGSDAQQLANDLYKLRPTRLVAPRLGSIRKELENAKPGIYIFERGLPVGPFTLEEAAARLPLSFG